MSDYEKIYRSDSIWKSILQMAVPALITILVLILYNMADMFFIGRLGDTSMVAAVSMVGPVFSLIMGLATMTGIGGSTVIANALGAGEKEKAAQVSSLCFWFSFVLGVAFIFILLGAREPLLAFLGATGDMHDAAEMYLTILAFGTPLLLLSTSLGNIVRAEGAVKDGLVGNLAGTVTNIVLDPLFILYFHWGVGGAAVATVLGNGVATCFYIFFMKRKSRILSMNPRLAVKNPAAILGVLALGLPNALSTIFNGFASTFSNQLLALHGTTAVAAMAAAGKSSMIIAMVQMGICMGVQPLLAYSYGAKDRARMKALLRDVSLLTLAIGLLSAAGCFAARSALIRLFLREETAVALGESFIPFLVLGAPFLGLYYISTNYLQAAKKAPLAILTSVLRQGVILIPSLYLFHSILGLSGIAAAHAFSDIASSVLVLLIFLHEYRKFRDGKETAQVPAGKSAKRGHLSLQDEEEAGRKTCAAG